ncbi:MAG: protein kinase [Myxococcota bacterium]
MSSSDALRFGPYVLLERIGDGGMAEIFRAKRHGYSGFEKQLALKRILPRYSGNETFVRMLINEAKLAAHLQHFNIVQVHDLGAIDGQVFLAMEYVRGRDVAAVLSRAYRQKDLIPADISLCIATEFLSGLDYAHRKRSDEGVPLGIIHRDISPQNILISYEGEVKVTDFGIARVVTEKNDALPGNLHGKFGYMSPEQVQGLAIDQRSDIFSAGVVLWEMLTGQRLFRGSHPEETVEQVVHKSIPRPSSINSEVTDAVDEICGRALERDRNLRFQTVGAFLGELTRASQRMPRKASPRDLAVYMQRHFVSPVDRQLNSRVPSVSAYTGLGGVEPPPRPLLGKVLRDSGHISSDDLQLGLAEQRARGGRLGDVLIQMEMVDEDVIARAVANQLGYRWLAPAELSELEPPPNLQRRFPRDAAELTLSIPFLIEPNGVAHVVTADPAQSQRRLELMVVLGVKSVLPAVTSRSGFQQLLSRWYPIHEPKASSSRRIVLLADADPEACQQVVRRLMAEDLDVQVVDDGRKALSVLGDHHVVVAMFDAALPRLDGLNLLLEARRKSPDTIVFISSRRRDDAHQARALELGAEDVLLKPLALEPTVSKLRRAAQRAMGTSRLPAEPVPAVVSGDISAMPLVDLVQNLEVGGKNAELQLQYDDGRKGRIFIAQGRLHRVEPAEPSAEEQFFRMAMPGTGRFRIVYRAVDVPANLYASNTYLLMEAMRRLDEDEFPTAAYRTTDLILE